MEAVLERGILNILLSILENPDRPLYPLYLLLDRQQSNNRAITLFNTSIRLRLSALVR